MTTALVRPPRAHAWELRACWATGRRVALSLDADVDRVEGHVRSVAATDAYVVVDGLHVPLERVLAVHRPSRLGDSTAGAGDAWRAAIPAALRPQPGQLTLDHGGPS